MYSQELPAAIGEATRRQKGEQVCAVLAHHCGSLDGLDVLDYGCSIGVMTAFFATRFRRAIGVDVDDAALLVARSRYPGLSFHQLREFPGEPLFDVIVANQVYNCVADQPALLDDIYRRLKPGGVCFFGARNKYALVEAQYHLPLLSMLPRRLGRLYLRACRGTWTSVGPYYRSRGGLLALFHRFEVTDYTIPILQRPEDFEYAGVPRLVRYLPLRLLIGLVPNYVFVLRKAA